MHQVGIHRPRVLWCHRQRNTVLLGILEQVLAARKALVEGWIAPNTNDLQVGVGNKMDPTGVCKLTWMDGCRA
jgi:hypothetical protein